ncbi:hypothetical protein PML78_12420 [Enterococcus dispar]|uniref:hypothetical protein n=1 Tax=Enterococcus dispar TaxID=44009 RepID=UPI00232CAD92|nr:hypothetical protein [Enterococcus dispar]WCG32978.1 hypothetical protein PML78_12420 [Enterococcus dispar]
MKEQVKEWIVDKNLTTDSFDSIMIGVIYNSGHNTLDDPDVRKWIETHPNEFRLMLPPKLTKNQQVVLDYLKKMCPPKLGVSAMVMTYRLVDDNINDNWQEYYEEIPKHIEALQKLSISEENQVLAAFVEWGLKEEE